MASNQSTPLCVYCLDARDDTQQNPVHVIHPVSGIHMRFDERGEAFCPICQAKWRRERNVMSLVEQGRVGHVPPVHRR